MIRSNHPLIGLALLAQVTAAAAFAPLPAIARAAAGASSEALRLASPDGSLVWCLEVRDLEEEPGIPFYSITSGGRPIIAPSRLGLVLDDAADSHDALTPETYGSRLQIVASDSGEHDTTWKPVCGERAVVRNHYRWLTVELQPAAPAAPRLVIEARAYDTGVAFGYRIEARAGIDGVTVARERTEFRLLGDHRAWAVYSAQGRYESTTISGLHSGCERPLVLAVDEGPYLAIGEARLVDFARMKLGPLASVAHALVSEIDGPATVSLPFRSPWRLVMVADHPAELLEARDIFENLNDPCALEETDWIRPGKVLREVTLTTRGGRACVDFAAAHGIDYVEFDAGWYGHEYDEAADAATVTVDPKRSAGPLDLPRIIDYARERGVGILLYVNRRALERQIDEILPLYQAWGIRGVKYGFVRVGPQRWTAWLHEAVRKAAAHRLMVDIHDEYRPTGVSRTYPNLMTQEGIAGDETSPSNEQTLTLLFTRMLCGAADNTICYYDDRVTRNASHGYQLAKAICLYSPWQFLYWYDRPPEAPGATAGGSERRNLIGNEPELELFAHLPTVWDDTSVIEGEIGAYATIARRRGVDWYVGCMNGGQARTFRVPLAFLDAGRRYTAVIYRDDPRVETRTHVAVERRAVDATMTLAFEIGARGGCAVRIVPRHELFVSPQGDDAQAGTRAAPLRSLEAARDQIRRERPAGDVVVTLEPGRYARRKTLRLDVRDSASAGHTITYRAEPGATVILDGGLSIAGGACTPVSDPAVRRRLLPEARAAVVQLDLRALGVHDFGRFGPRGFGRPTIEAPVELFVDGTPLEIARWPNRGEPRIPLGEVLDKGSVPRFGDLSGRGGTFRYETDRALRWTQASELHISGIFTWGYADDTVKIATIDTEAGTFTTAQPHLYGFGNSHQKSLWSWYAVNLLEEIDRPGEYFIDRARGIAYLRPPDSARPIDRSRIQVSLLSEPLVTMNNVSRVHWEGIIFENARGDGMRIEGGEEDRVSGCRFRNLGLLAVRASGARHGIVSCDIVDTGAGGVALGGGNRKSLAPGGCFVRNSDISRVNRWYKTYRPCVSLSGVGQRIEHCRLHDCPGQGVILSGNDHLIEFTEFGHLIGEMSDQGAIYMGRNPSHAGNVFRYNFFHHTVSSHVGGYGNSGIFFDDGDSGQLVEGCVFYRCGRNGAVKIHGGQFNSFINNLVIDCPIGVKYQLWDQKRWDAFLAGDQQQDQLLHQVDVRAEPYRSRYPRLARIFETPYSRERQREERNLLTTAGDPLFADGAALDFSIHDLEKLREQVPGFEPIPFEEIGLYADDHRHLAPR